MESEIKQLIKMNTLFWGWNTILAVVQKNVLGV